MVPPKNPKDVSIIKDGDRWVPIIDGERFGAHAFRPGEYVSIGDLASGTHTFRVISVRPAT
jgi:hypothetical protein